MPYSIVDAVDLGDIVARLTALYPARTPAAVLLNHVPRYNASKSVRLDGTHRIHEAYRGTCTHAYMVTKAAAAILVRKLYPIHVVADKREFFQHHFIAVHALMPYPIGTCGGQPANLSCH